VCLTWQVLKGAGRRYHTLCNHRVATVCR